MRQTVVVAAIAVFAITGCGDSDSDAAETAARGFLAAVDRGDAKAVCSLVGHDLKTLITGVSTSAGGHDVSCEAGFRAGPKLSTPKDPVTKDVSVDGNSATVTVNGSDRTVKVRLRKEGGAWKVVDSTS